MINKVEELYKEKKYEACIPVFEQILQEEQKALVDIYAKLAISYRMIKRFDKSEEILKKGLEAYPENNLLIIEFAALRNRQEKWEEAIELWGKAKRQSDNFSELNYERYLLALQKSNSEELLKKIVSEGLKKFPNNEQMISISNNISTQATLINNLLMNWEFNKVKIQYKDIIKLQPQYIGEYIRFLADTGQLDEIYQILLEYGKENLRNYFESSSEEILVKHKEAILGLINFYSHKYEAAETIENIDNIVIKIISLTKRKKVDELLNFIFKSQNLLFDEKSDAEQNMIFNYAINFLIKSRYLNSDLAKKIINLYYGNSRINSFRKKYVITSIFEYFKSNYNEDDFFKLPQEHYNHLEKMISILHRIPEKNDKKDIIYKMIYNKINLYNDLSLSIPNKKPKIAVCISGMYRVNSKALETIKKCIVEPLNADVYVHTWSDYQVWPGIGGSDDFVFRLFGSKGLKVCEDSASSFKKFKNKYPSVAIELEKPIYDKILREFYTDIFPHSKIKIDNQELFLESINKETSYMSRGNYNQAKMFFGISESFKMINEVESKEGHYDFIFRCRPDVGLSNQINFSDLEVLNNNEIAMNFFDYGPSDQLFYGKREPFKIVANIWNLSFDSSSLSPFKAFKKIDSHRLIFSIMLKNYLFPVESKINRNMSYLTDNSIVPENIKQAILEIISSADKKDLPFFNYILEKK